MSCLNPIHIDNPAKDARLLLSKTYRSKILVPCGRCVECRKNNASQWRVRLIKHVELGNWKNAFFVTLTIKPEYYTKDFISTPQTYIRKFLERYRWHYKKSLNHWFVTELGGKEGRLHFHGLIFDFAPKVVGTVPRGCCGPAYEPYRRRATRLLRAIWKYGDVVHVGDYVNCQTANYVVKYLRKPQVFDLTKFKNLPQSMLDYLKEEHKQSLRAGKPIDLEHYYFAGRVFCSKYIGAEYLTSQSNVTLHKQHQAYYIFISGFRYTLPRYYRDKIFTWEDLEQRRLDMMENPPPLLFQGRKFTNYFDYCYAKYLYYCDTLKRNMSVKPNSYSRSLFGIFENGGHFVEPIFNEFQWLNRVYKFAPWAVEPFKRINQDATQLKLNVEQKLYLNYIN